MRWWSIGDIFLFSEYASGLFHCLFNNKGWCATKTFEGDDPRTGLYVSLTMSFFLPTTFCFSSSSNLMLSFKQSSWGESPIKSEVNNPSSTREGNLPVYGALFWARPGVVPFTTLSPRIPYGPMWWSHYPYARKLELIGLRKLLKSEPSCPGLQESLPQEHFQAGE